VGYEHLFEVIRPFQDKQIKDDIIAKYEEERDNYDDASKSRNKRSSSRRDVTASEVEPVKVEKKEEAKLVSV
jgi:hypothetical protein